MSLRNLLASLIFASLLCACGGGPVRKVHPSTASIQQLSVLADGSWKLVLRIQNFSTFSMHFSALKAKLTIDGKDAGEITIAPDLDIVGNSGDVVEAALKTSLKLPASSEFAYQLKGSIDTSEPNESFKFDTASRLSPVPGVANTYR
ncbi:MAG: hypothetical protein ABIQ70_02880 [Dokdonella sp.]